MNEDLIFGLGFKTNEESNEFLRCLWAKIRSEFGKLAWLLSPFKYSKSNLIYIGEADIGYNESIKVTLYYSKRGCLKSIEISNIINNDCRNRIIRCIKTSLKYNEYQNKYTLSAHFEEYVNFLNVRGNNFIIEGDKINISVVAYDLIDAKSISQDYVQTICSILTFYTLLPICPKTSSKFIELEKCENVLIPKMAIEHIDAFLERENKYENHLTLLESAMEMFRQGLIMEQMSIYGGFNINSSENAIVNYMSALEIITTNDIKPTKCEFCGQMKFSIAKRVENLCISFVPDMKNEISKWIKHYYSLRSMYVHTGRKLSRQNYIGKSIPLLSLYNSEGVIMQRPNIPPTLKMDIRNIILYHEGLPIIKY